MADAEVHSLHGFFVEGRVDRAKRGDFDASVQRLVDVARTGDGRQELAVAGAVPVLLSLSGCIFPKSFQDVCASWWSFKSFHLYVKLLRNLCAGNSINQEALVASEGLEALAQVVEFLAPQYASPHGTCEDGESAVPFEGLQIVLQLLGNVAGHGEVTQARIWERFFPSVFLMVAGVANIKVQEPLCMLIYTCCRDNDSRCSKLAEGKGASIVASLLNRGGGISGGGVIASDAPNEWLEFLVSRLSFANPGLQTLFTSLGGTGWNISETNVFTKDQASLLDILNASLSAREEENRTSDPHAEGHHYTSLPLTSASFLTDVIRAAAKHAASTNLSGLKLPTQSPGADVLGLSLSMTRTLCVLDAKRSTIIPTFASSGLIPLLLNLLRALGLPDNAKTQDLGEQPPLPSDDSESFPRRDVYIGYRRDIVAVIANASHRSFQIQELVRENAGLLVVLQQCMPDTNNPFLREWGLWAIRNLLEGNTANQTEVADLEIQSTVPDARLREAGMAVEINPETGRPRLVNVASGTDNPAEDEFM
ncbi:hypothetical protein KC19_11G048500 [Ceratodon purpureus]|uniref:Ataxin-10 domain-containing protein n=1 Tax=Ceratodon purpureus TaxID=3225 RepID=A0A8T0GB42_CERPU|nr:hypothetical protein KC19_11G048500 [Ceratodon purpureus]